MRDIAFRGSRRSTATESATEFESSIYDCARYVYVGLKRLVGIACIIASLVATLGVDATIDRLVGMMFRQQVHEVFVEVPNKILYGDDVDALVDRFQEKYETLYGKGSALRGSGVEFTTLRTEATSPVYHPQPALLEVKAFAAVPVATRNVYFYRLGLRDTAVYRSEDLGPGMVIDGPAIIERPDTTIVVGARQRLEIGPYGNMIINLDSSGG